MYVLQSILDTLQFIIFFIYYCLEACVLKFFPFRKNVAGKIVLITGSANGIGREVALNFAHLGAILVLWDIDEEGLEETVKLVRENGARAIYSYKCDVGNREEVYATADKVKKEVGDVDILVNDAGVLSAKTLMNLSDSEIEHTLDVNTLAHFWTCRAFLPAMIANNAGHLVTVSSLLALLLLNTFSLFSDYSASKCAANGFLESVSFELWAAGKKGVNTTIVYPYYVNTSMVTGVKTLRPCLLPILDVAYVGKRIVDAILKEELYVTIPSFSEVFIQYCLLISFNIILNTFIPSFGFQKRKK
uniref:Epidermal retinol dehydrogenase 2 n=1 Tax=Salvator merianae TaxID=96440 RepID=A0A8D0DUW4_SALMN